MECKILHDIYEEKRITKRKLWKTFNGDGGGRL